MTGIDRSKVNLAFRIVRDDIKTTVPPCENTIDTSTHYEAVAKNGDQNHLLVYVIAHYHVITIGFSPDLSS